MTWQAEFDEQFHHTDFCLNFPGREYDRMPCRCEYTDIKAFIEKVEKEAYERVIEDIPDIMVIDKLYFEGNPAQVELDKLKQQLREKYLRKD